MLSNRSDYAIYTPAISAEFAKIGYTRHLKRSFSFSERDLNFLDPASGLFHYPYALYSAGQAAKNDSAAKHLSFVSQRDRSKTTVIGDSGGFQIQEGTIKFDGAATSDRMLRWLEGHADFSMTLDFPTGGISSGNVAAHTERLIANGHNLNLMSQQNGLSLDYNACLQQSLINLDYFAKNRRPAATNLLNVIQGRNEQESKVWYEAVKNYDLEGWAFAGVHQSAYSMVLSRLLDMFEDGLLQKARWIHVLGISTLPAAFLLTTILRCIREVNPDIGLSFDAASPFIAAANFQFCSSVSFDKRGYQIKTRSMPEIGARSDKRTLNELCSDLAPTISKFHPDVEQSLKIAFPAKTAVGSRVTIGEICIGLSGSSDLDNDSVWILMNHNVETYIRAFEALNECYDHSLHDFLPLHAYRAEVCIGKIFEIALAGKMKEARSLISRCAPELDVFA